MFAIIIFVEIESFGFNNIMTLNFESYIKIETEISYTKFENFKYKQFSFPI